MIHFVNRSERYFISTNYKVLFTFLNHQTVLANVGRKGALLGCAYNALRLPQSWRFYLLVRNPYQRIESFFKDKFRQDLLTTPRSFNELQDCQKLFSAFLEIDEASNVEQIQYKLLNFSFAEFLRILPEVYMGDPHLYPQVEGWSLVYRRRSVARLQFDAILKIEDAEDLRFISEDLKLDVSRKYNETSRVSFDEVWTPDMRAITRFRGF